MSARTALIHASERNGVAQEVGDGLPTPALGSRLIETMNMCGPGGAPASVIILLYSSVSLASGHRRTAKLSPGNCCAPESPG